MWYLTSDSDNRVIYIKAGCKEMVVGRSNDPKVCDFQVIDDSSISRRHAIILVSGNSLTLQDLGSTYGTFVNDAIDKKDALNKQVTLKECDIVKFGKLNSVWTVHKAEFTTCSSTLKGENLQGLKSSLLKLGGTWKNEWDDSCNYLTMPAITLTIKVVLALVQGSYIVTPQYWNKCYEAVSAQSKLPDPKLFTPQIIESTLNTETVTFLPDNNRRSIFQGKTFIFFSRRQMDMYKDVIVKGAGKFMLINETNPSKSMLSANNTILVQCPLNYTAQESHLQANQINDLISYLKSKGKRVVPDSEIGLAILFSSLKKHCNPEFSVSAQVMNKVSEVTKISSVLAKETQDVEPEKMNTDVVIDETLNNDNSEDSVAMPQNSNKRKIDIEDDVSVKRQALENNVEVNIDSEEGLFNFNEDEPTTRINEKKLNFTKPQKRKVPSTDEDDEDLFNFLPENSQKIKSEPNFFGNDKDMDTPDANSNGSKCKKARLEHTFDLTLVRGSKLKMEGNNENWKYSKLKTEVEEEICDIMNDLDLSKMLKTIDNLVKKERDLEFIDNEVGNCVNFKKFKKQANKSAKTIVSNSMSIGSFTAHNTGVVA